MYALKEIFESIVINLFFESIFLHQFSTQKNTQEIMKTGCVKLYIFLPCNLKYSCFHLKYILKVSLSVVPSRVWSLAS